MKVQPLLLCGAPGALCPALTLAAVHAVTADDPVLLAMASEHSVARPDALALALQRGAALAQAGYVVSFGMARSAPDGGHGLIRPGAPLQGASEACYVEALEPKAEAALGLLWNSGIIMVRASVWIEAVGCVHQDILALCERAYRQGRQDAGIWRLGEARRHAVHYPVLEALAALGSPAGPSPEVVVVRLESGPGATRAWDVVGPCASFVLAEHRLVARVGEDDVVLLEVPAYDDLRAAA
jgi:mannose-1-phosphate guanylyltransferase / mannose-6-phosphate isomerase